MNKKQAHFASRLALWSPSALRLTSNYLPQPTSGKTARAIFLRHPGDLVFRLITVSFVTRPNGLLAAYGWPLQKRS
jgi:hypothetical protein